jgi:hypothetical protein
MDQLFEIHRILSYKEMSSLAWLIGDLGDAPAAKEVCHSA